MRKEFMDKGNISENKETDYPTHIALTRSFGKIKQGTGHFAIGYDDVYAIQYFGENFRPYWNKMGNKSLEQIITESENQYDNLVMKSSMMNKKLINDPQGYLPVVYRSMISKIKIIEENDKLLLFTENGLIDMLQASNFYFTYNKELLDAFISPFMYYAESQKWEKKYAPINMGKFPVMNGFVEGKDMPLETTEYLLTLAYSLSDGNNTNYIKIHSDLFHKWDDFLKESGEDLFHDYITDTEIKSENLSRLFMKAINDLSLIKD